MSRRDPLRLADYLEHILEAIRRIDRYTRDNPEANFQLAHGYFKVDLEIVLRTIRSDLPRLEAQIRALLQGLGA